ALVAFGGFGAVLYAGLWMFMPTQRHTTPQAPGLDAASRQGKRGGRRERRLADYGPLVAVGAIAIGVLLLVTLATGQSLSFGPRLLRLSSDLSEEREARVRSEERADVAAHLHDSVLQTLALIQRSAGDPATVTRLARAQERDLRSWLFDSSAEGPATLAAALR